MMKLDGIHHVTCITGDAPQNVDYYTGVLGLRLVKKSVNQDDPTVYHLFYADEQGSAGSDITFFEYPGAAPGRAGAGMVHTVVWRVGSPEALDFWAARLGVDAGRRRRPLRRPGRAPARARRRARSGRAARRRPSGDPARARAPGLRGRARVRAQPGAAHGAVPRGARLRARRRDAGRRAATRAAAGSSTRTRPTSPASPARAPSTTSRGRRRWRTRRRGSSRVAEAGGRPTPIIDRFWFRSIYFREPSGVLFEIATLGPGFATDEDMAHLGEKLILPPDFEHLRAQVEPLLTPLPDPRESWTRA